MSTFDPAALAAAIADAPDIDARGFAAHAEAALAAGARPDLLGDLLVAWAAARGDRAALRRVDALLADLGPAVRRVDASAAFLDEVRQATRVKLLVGAPDRPPRIAAYAGRGPLRAWLQIAATRLALDTRRGRSAPVAAGDVLAELVSREPDPELRHLKQQYRAELRDALAASLAALPERARALLRLHFVDGVRLAELGRLYQVHESTASRWVQHAADQVADDTRRRLGERLALSADALASVARMVRSQLDLSIARLLA